MYIMGVAGSVFVCGRGWCKCVWLSVGIKVRAYERSQ